MKKQAYLAIIVHFLLYHITDCMSTIFFISKRSLFYLLLFFLQVFVEIPLFTIYNYNSTFKGTIYSTNYRKG